MWGLHSSQDADTGIAGKKHTLRNRITPKHNLIMEAMNAGMSTSSVTNSVHSTSVTKSVPTSSVTKSVPASSVTKSVPASSVTKSVPTSFNMPPSVTPTTSAASQPGLRVVMSSILSLASCVLSIF